MALKLGTENRKQVMLAGALGVLVVLSLIYFLVSMFSGGSAPTAAPVAVEPAPLATGGTREAPKVAHAANLDPTLHFELLQQTESLLYTGKGRNIFSPASVQLAAAEVVVAPVRPEPVAPPVPQGPPPPPPVDLKFYGFTAQQGGKRQVFLLHGDDVFIASEGDVVDHRYKVAKIAPFSVEITDIPYNNTQTLNLIADAAPPGAVQP